MSTSIIGIGFLVLIFCLQLAVSVPPLKPHSQPLGFDTPSLQEINSKITPRYRLPASIRPTNYKLEIQPILDEDDDVGTRFTAPGKIWIYINCTSDTSSITLHSNTLEINFESITVRLNRHILNIKYIVYLLDFVNYIVQTIVKQVSLGTTKIPVSSFTNSTADETYTIRLGAPGLKASMQYVIYIEFIALVATNRFDGLYLSSYNDANGSIR